MPNDHLATYLNDHLAGSSVALEMLEHLRTERAGTPLEAFFAGLSAEVSQDRRELESLMKRLGMPESRTRQASAWLAEKFTQLKLRVDDPAGGEFRLLQSLETLALGIEGKKSLWKTLQELAGSDAALPDLDYARLTRRAEEQKARVEKERMAAARQALVARG